MTATTSNRREWPSDLDDSSSFTGSFFTTSSGSTVPGPGAITGRFLKVVGERSLDLVVSMVIRSRLAAIERTLEKSPQILRDPIGDKEWNILIGAYKDLRELCRKSSSEYYPLSHQKAAARLIKDITFMTRSAPELLIDASPTNEKWEELFGRVQRREELFTTSSSKHDLVPSQPGSSEPPETGTRKHLRIKPGVNRRLVKDPARSPSMFRSRIFGRSMPVAPPKLHNPTRKVLVLGAGGVGKSTLVKQIQTTLKGSSKQDLESYRDVIIQNMMESLWSILLDVNPSDLPEESRVLFQQALDECDQIRRKPFPTDGLSHALHTLWNDPVVRSSAQRSRLGMLSEPPLEAADYFFDDVYRIYKPGYKPIFDDVIRSRVRTTGIWRHDFHIGGSPWAVIDTGGERSERKKWVNCFENTTAIIFVVALSDYNKTLFEDSGVNRMNDSLTIFYWVMRSESFKNSLTILLFNKLDLFVETLESAPLKDYFPEYSGEDANDACQYLEHRFLKLVGENRQVIVKYGCAINTEATLGTFRSIKDEINLHCMQTA